MKGEIEIFGPIEAGDLVALYGSEELEDQSTVTPVKAQRPIEPDETATPMPKTQHKQSSPHAVTRTTTTTPE